MTRRSNAPVVTSRITNCSITVSIPPELWHFINAQAKILDIPNSTYARRMLDYAKAHMVPNEHLSVRDLGGN